MKHQDYTGLIPVQHTGREIEADALVVLEHNTAAHQCYERAKSNLLNVNSWHHTAGLISAVFQLMDSSGTALNRSAAQGDHIRIDIPGPGSSAGQGYDWVQIEQLNEVNTNAVRSIGFRVRPVRNPIGSSAAIAHFYSAAASSSFIVFQQELTVCAWIVDRNLEPNDQAVSLMDKIRDTAIGLGAIGLFSGMQWKRLAAGLLREDGSETVIA